MDNRIECVIFDWAGTVVDYGCFAPVQAFMEIFHEFRLDPTMEEIRKPMGKLKIDHIRAVLGTERIAGQFKKGYGRTYTEEDVHKMYGMFEEKLLSILHDFAHVKPYVLETVEALRERGIKIGSTTGYTDIMMDIVVPGAAKEGYAPDLWFSPDSTGGMGRPYPYMIFKNMYELKVDSVHKVIKAGDTVSDILEGKNAGVTTVGVIEGSSEMGLTQAEFEALDARERELRMEAVAARFRDAGADYVVNDIRGILELV